MKAGKLDRKIALEREVETVDRYGTPSSVWTPIATVAAQRVTASTDEFLAASGERTETAMVFRVRYRTDVRLSDRVTFEGTAFNMIEIKELGRREGLELRCEARR
ncbi:phage head closure protein [Fulvimarina sp. 2208YS6-2-32]|uniref:Phage head closure protein n=1 Tax=Fulvimarina uroteuthidis TaxID=3098149 RepID=A0ABU5I6Z6_9HYPH|nr:phage head closure protein [Fulvimarina sp. 2208YS6-2-32]MDY8111163.1 phage head closure protein [Fulvimarina sp. 2208YS6-2-32]